MSAIMRRRPISCKPSYGVLHDEGRESAAPIARRSGPVLRRTPIIMAWVSDDAIAWADRLARKQATVAPPWPGKP